MSIDNLREFIAALQRENEIRLVKRPVSVIRDITEIADRCMKMPGGGPALLFEQPVLEGGSISDIPVGINLFGSMRRMALALGVDDLDQIGTRIEQLIKLKVPEGWREKIATLSHVLRPNPLHLRVGAILGLLSRQGSLFQAHDLFFIVFNGGFELGDLHLFFPELPLQIAQLGIVRSARAAGE